MNAARAAPASPPASLRVKASGNATTKSCRHCGAPLLDARMPESGFCCAGCAYVFRLVHEHGLSGYYNIKDDITTPADAAVFQPRDFSWLESAQQASEATLPTNAPSSHAARPARPPELTLDV